MPIFIDDITIASSNAAESDRVVQELSEHFKLRDLIAQMAAFRFHSASTSWTC